MPFALAAIAALLVITGIKGNYAAVGNQFNTDFMGANGTGGFFSFALGITGIAVFFRVLQMPQVGEAFLGLVILVFIFQNPNVLTAVQSAIGGTTTTAAATTPAAGTNTGAAQTSSTLAGSNPAAGNSTPLTTPAAGTGSGGIGSA